MRETKHIIENGKAARHFTITLVNHGGQSFEVNEDRPLLETLEGHGVSLPYGCRYGGCISCAAKLLTGEVDQSEGVALNSCQIGDGYVLLCVSRPLSNCTLAVGVESHDKLYRNPFQSPLKPEELKAGIQTGPKPMEDTR